MNPRKLSCMLLFLALTALRFVANAQDDRTADRAAIKAHIESIFQAFINKDLAALRETHAENWLGYLEGSRTVAIDPGGDPNWSGRQKILEARSSLPRAVAN
jgi:hypothetical protein